MDELELYEQKTFDDIKHMDKDGCEYWNARELMKIFSYKDWRYFEA